MFRKKYLRYDGWDIFFPNNSFYTPIATGPRWSRQPDGPNITIYLPISKDKEDIKENSKGVISLLKSSLIEEGYHFLEDLFQTKDSEWKNRPSYIDPLNENSTKKRKIKKSIDETIKSVFIKEIASESSAYFTRTLFGIIDRITIPGDNIFIPRGENAIDLFIELKENGIDSFFKRLYKINKTTSFEPIYERINPMKKAIGTFQESSNWLIHYLGYSLGRSLCHRINHFETNQLKEVIFNNQKSKRARLEDLITISNN